MKKVFWKIYFWLLVVLSITGYLWQGFPTQWEVIDLVLFLVAMIGFFAFCWRKMIFPKFFWKIFFIVFVVWNLIQQYFLPWPEIAQEAIEKNIGGLPRPAVATINILIFIPLLTALYMYAFKNKETKKEEEA